MVKKTKKKSSLKSKKSVKKNIVKKSAKKKHINKKSKVKSPKKVDSSLNKNSKAKSRKLIKDITQNPKEKIIRVPSGISGFDKLIQGGFVKSSVNTLVGGSGSGKTIFAMQFLMEGIKNGESCLYITFEEKKDDFYENMKSFGWDLSKADKSGKFVFLEYSPEKLRMMIEEGGGDVENIIITKKITRIVIDSITSFSLLFEDIIARRSSTVSLFDMLRNWDCTVLVTDQSDPSQRKSKEVPAIEFEADGIILFYFVRVKNKRMRYIEILKMRATEHPTQLYSFNIKKGIVVSGKSQKVNIMN